MVTGKAAAMTALLLGAALLVVGCGSRAAQPARGWYAPPLPPLSCALIEGDVPCVACAKSACCDAIRACESDVRCRCLLRCANRPWPFTECATDRCGAPNDLYRTARACLSERCAMCPSEH